MSIGKLLIDDQPLQVLPSLAMAIGLNEALVLQQVHYLLKYSRNVIEDKAWVFNSYEDWQGHFPFFSLSTIRRTINRLEELGLLISTSRFNRMKMDKTKWYSIDYEAVEKLELPSVQVEKASAENDIPSAQNEQSKRSNWAEPSVQVEQSNNQQNTQENTTRDIKKTTQKNPDLALLAEFGIEGDLAQDFIKHRKALKVAITKTSLKGFEREAAKAQMPITRAIAYAIERGWRGFYANWYFRELAKSQSNSTAYASSSPPLRMNDPGCMAGQIVNIGGELWEL